MEVLRIDIGATPIPVDRDEINGAVQQILDQVSDPIGVLTEETAALARDMLYELDVERFRQSRAPYTDIERRLFVGEFARMSILNGNRSRNDGTLYRTTHLPEAAKRTRSLTGLTDVTSQVIALHHDDEEDLPAVKANPSLLVGLKDYGVKESDLEAAGLKTFSKDVIGGVDGLSKLKKDTPEETSANMFLILLKALLRYGLCPAAVRCAERDHNLETIADSGNPERTVDETLNVYLPAAGYAFGYINVVRSFVDRCMKYKREELRDDFEKIQHVRLASALDIFRTKLAERFLPANTSNRKRKRFLRSHIERIEFQPVQLGDIVPLDQPFERLCIEDLGIMPEDTLFEITVITKPGMPLRSVIAYIIDNFGSDRLKIDTHPKKEVKVINNGVLLTLYNDELGGKINFRVIPSDVAARVKMGFMASDEYVASLPHDMRLAIHTIISETRESGRDINIFAVSKEKLMHPTITVYTPKGDPKDLPRGSTVLDFAAAVHDDFVTRIKEARFTYHMDDEKEANQQRVWHPIAILDTIQPNMQIELDISDDKEEIGVDQGLLHFCRTEKAKTALRRRHLRSGNENTVIQKGRTYIDKISLLFGIQVDQILAIVRASTTEAFLSEARKNNSTFKRGSDDILFFLIGRGSISVLRIISRIFDSPDFRVDKWNITVNLSHKAGILHRFTEEFEAQRINMDQLITIVDSEDPDKRNISMVVNDETGDKSVFDMLKIFLKLSYEYDLAVRSHMNHRGG